MKTFFKKSDKSLTKEFFTFQERVTKLYLLITKYFTKVMETCENNFKELTIIEQKFGEILEKGKWKCKYCMFENLTNIYSCEKCSRNRLSNKMKWLSKFHMFIKINIMFLSLDPQNNRRTWILPQQILWTLQGSFSSQKTQKQENEANGEIDEIGQRSSRLSISWQSYGLHCHV